MKLYEYHKGKIHSVEVTKVSEDFYYFEDCPLPFGCFDKIYKGHAHLTPESAANNAYNNCKDKIPNFEKKILSVQDEMRVIEKLKLF